MIYWVKRSHVTQSTRSIIITTIKNYYLLTKPGIIRGNVMTGAAGFLFASHEHFDLLHLLGVLIGTSLCIASACVLNNILDRHIDKKMSRTQKRALVTGEIHVKQAAYYALVLGILGFITLYTLTNLVTLGIGVLGVIMYVVVYGYFKRRSIYSTEVGSISGACSVTAGYTAATGRVDIGAVLLFLCMVFWQMPHFYSIALFRKREYTAAGLPLLPIKKGILQTKVRMCIYIAAYLVAICSLTFYNLTGITFLVVMGSAVLVWLWLAIQGFGQLDTVAWARRQFGFSLTILLAFSVMIAIAGFLP